MVLYVDGGCSGNGQRDMSQRRMVSVVTDERGKPLVDVQESGGSNNIAELLAVEAALQYCADRQIGAVVIYTDSRNNLSWVGGGKPGNGINDRSRVLRSQQTIQALGSQVRMRLEWVPREQNKAGHYLERHYGV